MNERLTWEKARASCWRLGGDLASVGSEEENNFIHGLSKTINIWLGGSDSALEGSYVWSDGTAWTYENWTPGEPNGRTRENCVVGNWRGHDNWNDGPCDFVYYGGYACEKQGKHI